LNCERDDSLSKFKIFETDQFLEEMKANFSGQGSRIREKLTAYVDVEDLQLLARMREKPLSFRKLDSFLKEFSPGV